MPILYVKGTLIFDANISFAYASLVVLDGGKVIFNENWNIYGYTANNNLAIYVEDGGEIIFNRDFKAGDHQVIVNKGNILSKGNHFEFYGAPIFYNVGKFTSDLFKCGNTDMIIYQLGHMIVKDELIYQSTIINYGKLEVDDLSGSGLKYNGKEGSLFKIDELESKQSTINLDPNSIVYIGSVDDNKVWDIKINNSSKDSEFALIIWGDEDEDIKIKNGSISISGPVENYCT